MCWRACAACDLTHQLAGRAVEYDLETKELQARPSSKPWTGLASIPAVRQSDNTEPTRFEVRGLSCTGRHLHARVAVGLTALQPADFCLRETGAASTLACHAVASAVCTRLVALRTAAGCLTCRLIAR